MKKSTFFITTLVIAFSTIKAQTPRTLQFSKALLVSSQQQVPSLAGGSGYEAVWKVVSLLPSSGAIANGSGYNSAPAVATFSINVNSNPIYFSNVDGAFAASTYGNYSYTNVSGDGKLPMWLPGGTSLSAGTNIQYISVLEFIVN